MKSIETFALVQPNFALEAVVSPKKPNRLSLHVKQGRRFITTSRALHAGTVYVPPPLPGGIGGLVRFAPPSQPFGSTAELISSLRTFFSTYACPLPDALNLLVAFVLATWFCDALPVAPMLYLFGPTVETARILQLLGLICRNAVLLGDLDHGSLATLARGLTPTLLINQRHLAPSVKRALLASGYRQFGLVRGSERLELFGAKVLVCEELLPEETALHISVSPARNPIPLPSDAEEHRLSQDLRAKLLRYRFEKYYKVSGADIDLSPYVPELREQARSWLAPTYDSFELTQALVAELCDQGRESIGNRLVDRKCVVTEAALSFCHHADTQYFFVGDLAERVNALMEGRHEDVCLSSRKAGSILRQLGIHGERHAPGIRIDLTRLVRERIHRLARDYSVASADGERRCELCETGQDAVSSSNE